MAAPRRVVVKAFSGASAPFRIPADYAKRIDALLAAIAEDRRQIEADGAIIAHLSRQTDERLDRIARQLDKMEATR